MPVTTDHSGAQTKPVRGRFGGVFLVGLAVVIAASVVITLTSMKNPRHVPARVFILTAVGYFHQTPGPWPNGNSFIVAPRWAWVMRGPVGKYIRHLVPNRLAFESERAGWSVINMHAENFSEIVRQLKLESVEIFLLDDRTCLVVDP